MDFPITQFVRPYGREVAGHITGVDDKYADKLLLLEQEDVRITTEVVRSGLVIVCLSDEKVGHDHHERCVTNSPRPDGGNPIIKAIEELLEGCTPESLALDRELHQLIEDGDHLTGGVETHPSGTHPGTCRRCESEDHASEVIHEDKGISPAVLAFVEDSQTSMQKMIEEQGD
jgi:hypothetical protein